MRATTESVTVPPMTTSNLDDVKEALEEVGVSGDDSIEVWASAGPAVAPRSAGATPTSSTSS
jgi:hypothetical protein